VPGQGRENRIAEVDIIGIDKETGRVELIVEVDPDSTPKKLLGNLTTVMLADNHTPSNHLDAHKIENAVFFFLTVLSDRSNSSKPAQYRLIELATRELFAIPTAKLKDVRLCYGRTVEQTIADFQAAIEIIYFPLSPCCPKPV
jgi:hypothetical protein